jgi:hypothetical protein
MQRGSDIHAVIVFDAGVEIHLPSRGEKGIADGTGIFLDKL